jgi:hypothetical protein
MVRGEYAYDLMVYAGPNHVAHNDEVLWFLVAWMQAENTRALWNPMATTEPYPAATTYNFDGVKNYPTERAGIESTWTTLINGKYPEVLATMKAGASAVAMAEAVAASPWGTEPFSGLAAEGSRVWSQFAYIVLPGT